MIEFNSKIAKSQIDLTLEDLDAPLPELIEPEFDDSLEMDLSSIYESALYDPEADTITEVELTSDELNESIISFLSENPSCVIGLHKNPLATLGFIAEQLNLENLEECYKSNADFNIFINAIAQGFVVSDNFVKAVPNVVKMYYITSAMSDSIHHRSLGGVQMYKSTPAITAFSKDEINALGSVYKQHKGAYKSLYNYLQAYCYKPVEENKTEISVLSFDDMTIAKSIVKSSKGITAGLAKLKEAGCDKIRLDRIAVLAKALKDSRV